MNWTGELIFLNDCGVEQFPECDNPPSRYGSLSITSHTLELIQRSSCSYSASYQWDATSTSCFDESDIATVSIVMTGILFRPFGAGDWTLNIKIARYLNGLPFGIGGTSSPIIADWSFAPDCVPPDGSCPCVGDYLLSGAAVNGLAGPEEQCDGYLLWQSLDAGSVVLS